MKQKTRRKDRQHEAESKPTKITNRIIITKQLSAVYKNGLQFDSAVSKVLSFSKQSSDSF